MDPRTALETAYVAQYFHHYITQLATWYDLSDAAANFGHRVPRLALSEPLLFSSVLALGAMHASKTTAAAVTARGAAEFYHGCCLRQLIAMDENDERLRLGVALAATCLLRSYEVMDEDVDPNRHLQGAYSIASQSVLPFSPYPELLSAGFWNYLREDITYSLFEQCPLKMDMQHFPVLSDLPTDQSYLNAVSLILARVINASFGGSMTAESWAALHAMVVDWRAALLEHMTPYYRSASVDLTEGLPSVYFLQECHAAATHYYLVTLALLTVYAPSHQLPDVEIPESSPLSARSMSDILEFCALEICGTAFTMNTPAVLVNAFAPMVYCGRFLRLPVHQDELVRRVLGCKKTTGWPVDRIVDSLKGCWAESANERTPATLAAQVG